MTAPKTWRYQARPTVRQTDTVQRRRSVDVELRASAVKGGCSWELSHGAEEPQLGALLGERGCSLGPGQILRGQS